MPARTVPAARSRGVDALFAVVVTDRSMEPSLKDGDLLWVRPRGAIDRRPTRGALVVVRDPQRTERWLIKRVVALGGERLLVGPTGVLRRPARGPPLDRPPTGPGRFLEEIVVPSDHVFVLSDRPEVGRDSRQFGPLPLDAVVGVAVRRAPARRATSARPPRPAS